MSDNACKLIDFHLRPSIFSLPSFVKDTTNLLEIIYEVKTSDNALLVTIDVQALYSSIPQSIMHIVFFIWQLLLPRGAEHSNWNMLCPVLCLSVPGGVGMLSSNL